VPREDEAVFRLRKFRAAVAAVVAFPFVLTVPLCLLSGSRLALSSLVFALTLNGLLVFFAWRKPGGFASWWVVLRQFSTAVCYFSLGDDDFAPILGTIEVLSGVLLVWLLISMWGDIRRQRADEKELLRTIDAFSRREARSAMRARAKAERRMQRQGYS
jgi:hypothetical protein